MQYPEFRDAEYSTTDIPAQNFIKANGKKIKKYLLLIICLLLILFGSYHCFDFILAESESNNKLALVSVGSALVTVFSALISVLTLVNANCLKKYDDDITLLQTRYLKGRKIFKWEFLNRSSNHVRKAFQKHNYYISSACYKLFCDNTDEKGLVIVVPILEVDFYDIPCVNQIIRIRRFLPDYLLYINEEQKKYDKSGNEATEESPNYYLPLPYHLIALYKNIVAYKVTKLCIEICFLFIISSVCITVLGMI